MGWSYRDHALLQELQDELELGFVVHDPGTVIWDFQTTDMTKPHMVGAMWTLDANGSLGVFKRGGGGKERDTADTTAHLRHRHDRRRGRGTRP